MSVTAQLNVDPPPAFETRIDVTDPSNTRTHLGDSHGYFQPRRRWAGLASEAVFLFFARLSAWRAAEPLPTASLLSSSMSSSSSSSSL